jgi:hypothetical protein
MAATTSSGPSSRASEEGAGWQTCTGPGAWKADVPAGAKPLSWLRPSILWQARNDTVARVLSDPVPAARSRWMELAAQRAQEAQGTPDFVISREVGDSFSVLVLGDTGEGDNPQYAVAYTLAGHAEQADFAFISSDVIYPTGDGYDYPAKFYHPYRKLPVPIYAVPGNHDWHDGLTGFMHNFCKMDDSGHQPDFGRGLRAGLAAMLWRRPQNTAPRDVPEFPGGPVAERPPPDPIQPAPYFAIDAGRVRFVGIDTGIKGDIDAAQYEWLQRVSLGCPERPKILLTGKPIYVDNEYHPGPVIGMKQKVDDVVTDPRANYVMAIGGDIHNYQRYPVKLADGRTIQYVVSGGGGAYMHATHRIPPVNINGVTEAEFRCYPLRRDSLARFSQVIDQRLFGGRDRLSIDPASAARYYADRGVVSQAERQVADALPLGRRIKAALLRRLPSGRLFQRFGSETFAFTDPPFFKQFLHLEVNKDELTVSCFGVTGCAGTENLPPVEDSFTVGW